MDVDNNWALDLEEFKRAVRAPSTIEQLFVTLPISQILADAMPDMTWSDRLRQFGQKTPDEIEDICNEAMPFLKSIIRDTVKRIEVSVQTMDALKANQSARTGVKFEVPPEMSAGSVGDYHDGLTGKIGKKHITRLSVLQQYNICCCSLQGTLLWYISYTTTEWEFFAQATLSSETFRKLWRSNTAKASTAS